MKLLLLTLSLFLLSLPSFGLSQERPETIVIPVSSVGDVTETRKLILQNTLEDELKTHFRLISQEKFEEAQEKAFEELDYEECTEERCIILIQEMLQVENVFHLQVIGEGKDTQLSLSWRTLDEKRKEEEFCEGCGTNELRRVIIQLVSKLTKKNNQRIILSQNKEITKKVDLKKKSKKNTYSTFQENDYNTTSFGISFVYPFQYPSYKKNIRGLRLNLIGAYNESVNGVDITWFPFSGTNKSKILQLTAVGLNYTNEMEGMQFIFFGFNYSSIISTYQLSLVGSNITDTTTLQLGFTVNVAKTSTTQIGLINYSDNTNFQIGFINITKNLKGIQIGLINIVKEPSLSFGYVLPFFNASF